MQISNLAAINYGGYASFFKLVFMLALYMAWMPLVNWIYMDSQAVRTEKKLWTAIMAIVGFISLAIWLFVPVYLVGFLTYIILVGAVAVTYINHRNSKVAPFEKILTTDHLRNLFVNPTKKFEKMSRGLSFITANKNEVPFPEPKSPEAEAFIVVCEILDDALWRRVSQIFLIPQKENYSVIYEIDGVTARQNDRSREEVDNLVRYLKQIADLEIDEKRKPQNGTFTVLRNMDWKKTISWEIQTSGSTAGEQIKLIKSEDYCSRKLTELGLNENQFESIRSLKEMKSGLIILSGPPKSGVTSTLYALIGNHDPFINNINTLEKKIAATLHNITQNEFSLSDTGTTTYSKRLQSLFRRGPDIVGVEDCEDEMCAKLCCSAAKDGKLVYATMEATSVAETMEKFLKLLGDKALLADTLEAVINQRLVRSLCQDCKQAYKPNQSLFKKFNIPADEVDMFYRPGEIEMDKHGKPVICEKCQGTGFYGRMGLFETIRITDPLRQAIRNSNSVQDIVAEFRKAGMLYMQEQSIKKVTVGTTSINEVIRNFGSKNG